MKFCEQESAPTPATRIVEMRWCVLVAAMCLFAFAVLRIGRFEPPEEWVLSESSTEDSARREFRFSTKSEPELYLEVADWLSSVRWAAPDLTSYAPLLRLRSDKIDVRFLNRVTAFATSSGGNAPMWSRSWRASEADTRLSERLRAVLHERGARSETHMLPAGNQLFVTAVPK